MKPEQQRIKIAEACGEDNDSIVRELIPDYLNDLNAMHEAEKVLKGGNQRVQYMEKLGYPHNTRCTFANASQRAEAFLRTLNLWEE